MSLLPSIAGSDCQFHFHLQPRAELNCNPYHQDRAATVLHITCLAIGPVHSELEVEWWYNNSNLTAPERVDLGTHRVIEDRDNEAERAVGLLCHQFHRDRREQRGRGGGRKSVCVVPDKSSREVSIVTNQQPPVCERARGILGHKTVQSARSCGSRFRDRVCDSHVRVTLPHTWQGLADS